MICTYCGVVISDKMVGPFKVYQPTQSEMMEEKSVCGRCYMIISIHDKLEVLTDGDD